MLVVLNTDAAWSRGILRGFMASAHERDWTLLHYHSLTDLSWLAQEFEPAAAVIGPEVRSESLAELGTASLVSVTFDRSAERIASVCLDEAAIAGLALEHLLSTGLRQVSTFRYGDAPFAVAREQAFAARARAAGASVSPGWGSDEALPAQRGESKSAMVAWLRALPKPCGIFTCTDGWARAVVRYTRVAGLRVPEDIALIGADNDTLECELIAPPLSSVVIPWREVGKTAAELVTLALRGVTIERKRRVLAPVAVIARRSSDLLAIDDALVEKAVRWIRAHAERRLTVTMVARAVGGGRQRLERRFRAVLDRTVQEEIRRAHVQAAKTLLETSHADLSEVARQSGFTNAALLSVAFQRELGMPPGRYRRRVQQEIGGGED